MKSTVTTVTASLTEIWK